LNDTLFIDTWEHVGSDMGISEQSHLMFGVGPFISLFGVRLGLFQKVLFGSVRRSACSSKSG
jgi:hypothetical protein